MNSADFSGPHRIPNCSAGKAIMPEVWVQLFISAFRIGGVSQVSLPRLLITFIQIRLTCDQLYPCHRDISICRALLQSKKKSISDRVGINRDSISLNGRQHHVHTECSPRNHRYRCIPQYCRSSRLHIRSRLVRSQLSESHHWCSSLFS
jgi:hypothetical protein